MTKDLKDAKVDYDEEVEADAWVLPFISYFLLPMVMLGILAFILFQRFRDPLGGGFLGNYIKSPARRYEKAKMRVTFNDVADMTNAKRELQEIVEFLKGPEKFQRLGAQIPKGVLLDRAAGHGQDAAGPGRGRRGGRAVLQHQRLGVHPDVRRRRRQPGARHVQDGQGKRSLPAVHRRDRRRGPDARRRRRRRLR